MVLVGKYDEAICWYGENKILKKMLMKFIIHFKNEIYQPQRLDRNTI